MIWKETDDYPKTDFLVSECSPVLIVICKVPSHRADCELYFYSVQRLQIYPVCSVFIVVSS
jgi:hypothetical protein